MEIKGPESWNGNAQANITTLYHQSCHVTLFVMFGIPLPYLELVIPIQPGIGGESMVTRLLGIGGT